MPAALPKLSENSESRKFAVAVTWALSKVLRIALTIFAKVFISERVYDSGGGASLVDILDDHAEAFAGAAAPSPSESESEMTMGECLDRPATPAG